MLPRRDRLVRQARRDRGELVVGVNRRVPWSQYGAISLWNKGRRGEHLLGEVLWQVDQVGGQVELLGGIITPILLNPEKVWWLGLASRYSQMLSLWLSSSLLFRDSILAKKPLFSGWTPTWPLSFHGFWNGHLEPGLLDYISPSSLFFTSSGLSHHRLILGPYFSSLHISIDSLLRDPPRHHQSRSGHLPPRAVRPAMEDCNAGQKSKLLPAQLTFAWGYLYKTY